MSPGTATRSTRASALTARIGEILVGARVVDDLQFRSALAHQAKWGGRIGGHLVDLGFAGEPAVVEALANALGLPKADLTMLAGDRAAMAKLDAEFCKAHGVFPMSLENSGKVLCLAMAEPGNLETVDAVAAKNGCRIRVYVAGDRSIADAVDRHYLGVSAPRPDSSLRSSPGLPDPIPLSSARPAGERSPMQAAVATEVAAYRTPLPFKPETIAATPPAVMEYLQTLRTQLDKVSRVLRALVTVANEKGLFTPDDVRAAAAKLPRAE